MTTKQSFYRFFLSTLLDVRFNRDSSPIDNISYLLGFISSAELAGFISVVEASRLRDLLFNASEFSGSPFPVSAW